MSILKIRAILVLAMGDGPKNREKIRRLRRNLLVFLLYFLKEIPEIRRLQRMLLVFPLYFLKEIPKNCAWAWIFHGLPLARGGVGGASAV